VYPTRKKRERSVCVEDLQVAIQYEQFLASVFHDMTAEMVYEECNGGRPAILVFGGKSERMMALIREEHL
jgi:hypothetical protein